MYFIQKPFESPAAPLLGPSRRWGQTLCPIDAQTAILIGGQGARMQFCKDPIWKLCTGRRRTPRHILTKHGFSLTAFVSVPQRTCPGWRRRLWRRVPLPRAGSATPLSTTPTPSASLYSGGPRTGSGSTTSIFWTRGAGSGPWWR